MQKERINALITLLDDPNDEIFSSVEKALLNEEVIIVPELERAWELSRDNICQHRIENIIHTLQLKDVKTRIKRWAMAPQPDLLTGAWLVARYQYPELEFEDVNHSINALRKDIWLELNEHLTALEKVRIMNHILFDVHGFARNTGNPGSAQNLFICDVLDTKKGDAVSLSVVYSVIAQRLGLPIYGVNLSKNFLLAWVDEAEIKLSDPLSQRTSVLFYINPIHKGEVLGRKEIEFFLKQHKLEQRYSYYTPCSNVDFVKRMFKGLMVAFEGAGLRYKSAEIKEFISILERQVDRSLGH